MKAREFYWLFVNKSYTKEQTGVKRWNKIVTMDKESWQSIFISVRTTSKVITLREFHFKFLHRKRTFQVWIDSRLWMFILWWTQFSQHFIKNIVQWSNQTNKTNFNPGQSEILFGVLINQDNTLKRFNYTLLFMQYFIYKCKLKKDTQLLPDFINKLKLTHCVET